MLGGELCQVRERTVWQLTRRSFRFVASLIVVAGWECDFLEGKAVQKRVDDGVGMSGDLDGEAGRAEATENCVVVTKGVLMIAASVVLSPRLSRWINIGYGGLSTLVIPILALTSDTWGYYYLFNFFEVVLTAYVVWLAIKWPRQLIATTGSPVPPVVIEPAQTV